MLTPKLAQKIQEDIYYNMSAEKKIQITSQFFMLGRKLKTSKTLLKNGRRLLRSVCHRQIGVLKNGWSLNSSEN